MKTIKQIADELGVTKQAVRKKITSEIGNQFLVTKGNTIYIMEPGEVLIKSSFTKSTGNQVTSNVTSVTGNQSVTADSDMHSYIAVLQQQLEVKDNLIVSLSKQNQALAAALEHTTSSLEAAQALHAGTIKQQSLLEAPPAEAPAEPDKPGFFDRLRQAFK